MKKFFRFGSSSTSLAPTTQGDGASDPVLPPAPEDDMVEMSFLDHLEELRWSLFRGIGGIIVITIACSFFSRWIIDVLLLGPAQADFFIYELMGFEAKTLSLQNRVLTGQFMVHFGVILSVGIVLGSPIFIYSLWKFIEPGLYKSEKKGLRFAAVFATLFFALGISFGYLIITPVAIQFFSNYEISPMITNDFDIVKYFTMVTFWSFGTGVLFELPIVVYFLAKVGIATPARMRGARRYALVIAMILGAVFTPPDPFSMILVSTPLYLLYECSIFVARSVEKGRQKSALTATD
jgi:sec-independent protein translocase protein TatC